MIIGHQKQREFLKKSVELGKVSHAYLFTGQDKLGKKTVALEFLSLLLRQPSSQILAGVCPDFISISPVKNEIQIEQIRELNWKLSLKPFSAPFKAVIIESAHLMNAESQNCFLKTLEEPKGNTCIILITEYPELLFSTIVSRCEVIKFYPVSQKEIENHLRQQGLEEEKIKLISRYSQGRPGAAIDFLNRPAKIKEWEKLVGELTKVTKSGLVFRFQYVEKIAHLPQLKEILILWLSYFRQKLIFELNFQNAKIPSRKIKDTVKVLEKIQETFFLLSTTNVNPRLALEILMLDLYEL